MTNLSTVGDARDLEDALEPRFPNLADRRFAARGLFQLLRAARDAGDELPNVGIIRKATATADAIERTPSLVAYRERLRDAREHAARSGQLPPRSLPLFTSDDLATLKPSLVVRTPETFARATLAYGAAYLAAFYFVVLLWWRRAVRGDEILLAAAHLLTAVGFALLLSRPDPLRDTMLFVRYTEGVLLGLGLMGAVSFVDFRKAAFLDAELYPAHRRLVRVAALDRVR